MKIKVQYFAQLREQRGCSEELVQTQATTPEQLYSELRKRHEFQLDLKDLKVAKGDQFCSWDEPLDPTDLITFLPPVGGG
jgi:molybdopterin converting factor small subunit